MTKYLSKDVARPSAAAFWLLTFAYVGIAAIAVVRNWESMIVMDPNEWGDVAAGVFSPLAFLWFLFTALAQRAELKLQYQELQENVESQRQQEQQMGRQADALDAQVRWQNAQATAQFDPILVIYTTGAGDGTDTRLWVENLGSAVLDVQFTHGRIIHLQKRSGDVLTTPKGTILSHWLSNHVVCVDIREGARIPGGPGDLRFDVLMKRLDTKRVVHTYLLLLAEQRLVLEHVQKDYR